MPLPSTDHPPDTQTPVSLPDNQATTVHNYHAPVYNCSSPGGIHNYYGSVTIYMYTSASEHMNRVPRDNTVSSSQDDAPASHSVEVQSPHAGITRIVGSASLQPDGDTGYEEGAVGGISTEPAVDGHPIEESYNLMTHPKQEMGPRAERPQMSLTQGMPVTMPEEDSLSRGSV